MKKRWITCIVFASLGTVLALAGAIGLKFDFSSFKRGELQNFTQQLSQEEYKDNIQSLKIINYYGTLNVSMSDEVNDLSLAYTSYDEKDVSFTVSSNGLLNISKGGSIAKPTEWYNAFGYFEKKGTLDIVIPSSWALKSISFDVRKGTVIAQNLRIDQQIVTLYNGKIQMNTIAGKNLEITTYNGKAMVENATFDDLTRIRQTSGKVVINNLSTKVVSFQTSLSQLNVALQASMKECSVQIAKKVLSSTNLKNQELTDNVHQIEGKMSCSKVKFTFLKDIQ